MTSALVTIDGPAADRFRQPAPIRPLAGLGAAWAALRNLSGGSVAVHHLARRVRAERVVTIRTGDSNSLQVRISGRGRPIVLVHGLGGSAGEWDAVAAALADGFTVVRYDQRGHGSRVDTAAGESNLARMAEDLASVIDRCSLDRPILVGHSMGALSVMHYLQQAGTASVGGVCFVDQSPRVTVDDDWALGVFGSLNRCTLEAIFERLHSDFAGTVLAEMVPALSPLLQRACSRFQWIGTVLRRMLSAVRVEPLLAMLESIAECDYRGVMSDLGVPALVVLGGRSSHYGHLPLAQYYAKTLRDGCIHVYPGAMHSPHRQEPGRFAADLRRFAQRLAG